MANTYSQIYMQTVFAVKYRQAVIDMAWKDELCSNIGNIINEMGCKNYIVNGVEDHIHCFFGLSPSVSISKVMQAAKARSSKWINDAKLTEHRFEWQVGYGCFSYSHSHRNRVFEYVKKQEEHHKTIKFLDEYHKLLKHSEIPYDEQHIFHELI